MDKSSVKRMVTAKVTIPCMESDYKKVQKWLKEIGTHAYANGQGDIGEFALQEAIRLDNLYHWSK